MGRPPAFPPARLTQHSESDLGERSRATAKTAAPGAAATRAPSADATPAPSTRREELRSFLFFTVVMAPVFAVLLVAGYGFVIWMYQLVAGPPGA